MHAVDTNVIVRYLIEDDPDQFRRACIAMERNPVWLPVSVLLETEWVLRRGYRRTRPEILKAVRRVLGLANLEMEQADAVANALGWFAEGMDFADALHLATASQGCARLLTFDREFITVASRVGAGDVAEP